MFPNLQLAIVSGPMRPNAGLLTWATRFDHWRLWPTGRFEDHLAARRNALVAWFLAETDLAALWMIDADMVPIDRETALRLGVGPTEALAETSAHAGSCRYIGRPGEVAHGHGLAAGCLLASRVLLAAMGPPWFRFGYDADHTALTECECRWFTRRARGAKLALPIQLETAGTIAHAGIGAIYPDADGRPAVLFAP